MAHEVSFCVPALYAFVTTYCAIPVSVTAIKVTGKLYDMKPLIIDLTSDRIT